MRDPRSSLAALPSLAVWMLPCLAALGSCAAPATAPPPVPVPAPAPAPAPAPPTGGRPSFETRLLPAVRLEGQPERRYTMEERMAHYRVSAVSIARVHAGRVVFARAYGTVAAGSGRPADVHTRFQAASISKPVAALTALSLVQQGTLELDSDVHRWLRRWRVPASEHARGRPVSLRTLLSHTAGLTVSGFGGYARGEQIPDLVQVLAGAPPANSPPVRLRHPVGSRFQYSGGGFTVLQMLLEDATALPFVRLVGARILGPLGMRESFYGEVPAEAADQVAQAHLWTGRPVAGGWHRYPEQAAAGLWTTPGDLAQVIVEIQRAAAGQGRVLGQDLARRLLEVQPHSDYGLGLGLLGQGTSRRFVHGGSNVGYQCKLAGYIAHPDGVVIMSNGSLGGSLVREIFDAIAEEQGWEGRELPVPRPVARPFAPADLAALPGRYALPEVQPEPFRLQADQGRLFAVFQQGSTEEAVELFARPDGRLVSRGPLPPVRPVRDPQDVVSGLELSVDGQRRVARRVTAGK
jgi:CubicO group peptidase (beta-lactamase class C family)